MSSPRVSLVLRLVLLGALAACADVPRDPAAVEPPAQSLGGASQERVPPRAQERAGTMIELSDSELWAALAAAERVATVGLKAPGATRGVYRGEILVAFDEWRHAARAVTAQRGVRLLQTDPLLPTLEVELADLAALRAVRRLPFVDYVEPARAPLAEQSWASMGGCGWGTSWTGDRQLTAAGDVYSERFAAMSIPAAWQLSQGAGVTIGLTDTGISVDQRQFYEQFATGQSAGRWIRRFYLSSVSSAWDECGHGTRMAGVLAAPNDGINVAGVAWRSNMVSIKQANGVANVSSSDARASVRAAAQNGAHIINMAWQSMNWWWQVSDEIEYWHYRGGRLFIAAAGTSGCGDLIPDNNVVFPAEMSVVVAVTGIRYPDGAVPCGIHYGKQVELTAYLDAPTTGRYTPNVVGIGGSSNATAIVTGIAALTWSANPSLSRDQVRQRLQRAGALHPNRSSTVGFGLVDALKAVRGY